MNKLSEVNSSVLLLLTGCINPNGMEFTKLQNADIRRTHYIDAINFYLTHTKNQIVFIENSGTDISDEFEQFKERIEFIVFSGNDYDKKLGKGYGEMLILKHAFLNSAFIKQFPYICKITGRYKILNIGKILSHFGKCDCDLMIDLLHKMKYSDSRIFIANKFFFENYLLKTENQVNDSKGIYFEHLLRDAVLFSIIYNISYLPFKYKPRIVGVSGTDGKVYDYAFWQWFFRYLKQKSNFKYFVTPPKN